MRRILAALLAISAVMNLTMHVSAESELVATDRVTAQLAEIQRRRDEITVARAQQEAARLAAIYSGRNSDSTDNLSYFINQKILTKNDYEAFKWSFIFSQFAVPLEDTFIDVFSQENFQEMINDNFEVTAVKEYIITDSTDTVEGNHTTQNAMLQNANVTTLVETMKENYYVYPLYDENDNHPTLSTIINAASELSIFDRFYLYDTVAVSVSGTSGNSKRNNSTDAANSLFYNQDILIQAPEGTLPKISEGTKIPVFVYDANAYLYLQLAIGAYCVSNSITVSELLAERGSEQLAIDSFGNICSRMADGRATILLPNFGNTFLNAKEGSSKRNLEESINLYNKWFTTLYSRYTRGTNAIYPTEMHAECLDKTEIKMDVDTGEYLIKGTGKIANHYSSYIPVSTASTDISQMLVLVETSNVTAELVSDIGSQASGTKKNRGIFTDYSGVYDKNSNTLLNTVIDIFNTIRSGNRVKLLKDNSFGGSLDGHLMSPFNFETGYFAPFLASKSSDQDTYINNYAILQMNVGLSSLNSTKAEGTTHIARFANSLAVADWSINRTHYYSSVEGTESSVASVISLSDLVTLVTRFTPDQVIPDARFTSWYRSAYEDGSANIDIFLPKDPLDVGQEMTAYSGKEKGMIIPQYKLFFSGTSEQYRAAMKKFAELINADVLGWLWDNSKKGNVSYEVTNEAGKTIDIITASEKGKQFAYIWNASIWSKNDSAQKAYVFRWDFDNVEYSQDLLKYLYTEITSHKLSFGGNDVTIAKTSLYAKIPVNTNGDYNLSGLSITTSANSNDESHDYFSLKEYYYLAGPISTGNYYLSVTGTPAISSANLKTELDKVISSARAAGSTSDAVNVLNNALSSIMQAIVYKTADLGAQLTEDKYLSILAVSAINTLALQWGASTSPKMFETVISNICDKLGCDYNTVLMTYYCLYSYNKCSADAVNDGSHNLYFYDEYQYFLRSPSDLSKSFGCNSSSDFATVTYFWDRHYLTNSAMQTAVQQIITDNWTLGGGEASKSMSRIFQDYDAALKEHNLSAYDYTLADFVEQGKGSTTGTTNYAIATNYGVDKKIYTPYYYEYGLQETDFTSYSANEKSILEQNNATDKFTGSSTLYNYLAPDTIIIYPFSCTLEDRATYKVYGGAADSIVKYCSEEDISTMSMIEGYSPTIVIMALQCNTDFIHNSLAVTPTKDKGTTHVTKEELMDNANVFFTNPVSSLMYIMSGFLYKFHAFIATGNFGSVFSINWILESNIYKWIMNRYVAIVTIAVVLVLFLKLIQFAMNKSRNIGAILKDCTSIIAMCLVPLVIFNSFVWAFDTTSKWAMNGSTDKILLSQINQKVRESINSDARQSAELTAFKEQFSSLSSEYDCLSFEQMTSYSISNGPQYQFRSIWEYVEDITFSELNYSWYNATGFTPVHKDKYSESLFYYFYDFFRSEYQDYCSSHAIASVPAITQLTASKLTALKDPQNHSDAAAEINVQEQSFAQLKGNVKAMLEDVDFIYHGTYTEAFEARYGTPRVIDIAGLYYIFNNDYYAEADKANIAKKYDFIKEITGSCYYEAFKHSEVLLAEERVVPVYWTDAEIALQYLADAEDPIRSGLPRYNVITSYHDLFSMSNGYNESKHSELSVDDLTLTPLEEKLCEVSEKIYDDSLKALNYMPSQIYDQSALVLMAVIATCRVNEAFGCEPTEPILQSVTLDSFIRTAFLDNLDEVGGDSNTMYAMVSQGSSLGEILLALMLELMICIASIFRILCILYITAASFIIFGLRALHKAPRTNDLYYGIISAMFALLFMHALTLFLVVVAIEVVAGAASALPSLLLNISMIVFVILIAVLIINIVKNMAQDALNLGGTKIRGAIRSIGDNIVNAVHSVFHSENTAENVNTVNLKGDTINSEINGERQNSIILMQNSTRMTQVLEKMAEIESESYLTNSDIARNKMLHLAEESWEQTDQVTPNTRVEQNIQTASELEAGVSNKKYN